MHAIIFIGIQASGKTTFYERRLAETHIRISMDALKTRAREQALVEACIAERRPFVIDNTNVLRAERASYIEAARRAGYRVTGYYFQTPVRAAIARNAKRADKKPIPVVGILAKQKRLEPPSPGEGFDELFTVELTPENEFRVRPSEEA